MTKPQEFIVDTADIVRLQWAEWLVAAGYPYDFWTEMKLPDSMWRPLAEAWHYEDDSPDNVTVEEYEATIREEAREFVAGSGD